jgi:hypothetical protein
MDYDWTGMRTRRMMRLKITSGLLLVAGCSLTLLLWLPLSH